MTSTFFRFTVLLALVLGVVGVASKAPVAAQQRGAGVVAVDPDDIGGVVTSAAGPERGVWVVAETTGLPTRLIKIVVTDDQGRYLIPDLPSGVSYDLFVRGYGLVDSERVQARPGQVLNLKASLAPDAKTAAAFYPPSYWVSLLEPPAKSEFPGTGPSGNGIPATFTSQDAWISSMKAGCFNCHELGSKITREPMKGMTFPDSAAMWDRRVKNGQSGAPMSSGLDRLGRDRAAKMFGAWTDKVAAGEYPTQAPPRPTGIERNVVVTMWDWSDSLGDIKGNAMVHSIVATDKRNPLINAGGPVYGSGNGDGTYTWVDPKQNKAFDRLIPSLDPARNWPSNNGPQSVLAPSPYWGTRLIWDAVAPHNPMLDSRANVWMSSKIRPQDKLPAFCHSPSNKYAAYYPIKTGSGYQLTLMDAKTNDIVLIDTCANGDHVHFGWDQDEPLHSAAANVFTWVSAKKFAETKSTEDAYGWCPAVLDTNGDGTITKGWNEPDAATSDPTKDSRVNFACYDNAVNPVDGTVWCAAPVYPGYLTMLDRGKNAPQSCKAERFEVPAGKGYLPRGLDFDTNGLAWVTFAGTGHFASFDRRKCKVLNGPTATGSHCSEGWTFYESPGPKLRNSQANADFYYMAFVDQFDTLGLGKNVPLAHGSNSNSLVALIPSSKQFVRMTVPYPFGFYPRSMDGRIDDAKAGWKGRGMWSSYSSIPLWHQEGGLGGKSKVVQFQIRPDPLAK